MSEYIKNGVASRTFNTDCLLKMKEYPDGYFDLAVVDPPYGGGVFHGRNGTRFGGRFEKYTSQEPAADGRLSSEKKLWLGTTRQAKSISMNCFAFLSNRSYGAEITSTSRRADALLRGIKRTYRKNLQCRT